MKPVAFDIVRAGSIGEATRLLAEHDGDARLVAGAQSLGPMLNLRLAQPRLLIDITGIRELIRIEETGDAVTVGACVTTANIEDGRLPGAGLDPLRAIATGIAYRAVRNRATVGGSLCHADPAADWVTVLCALGAECSVTGVSGTRRVPVDQFITGAYETSLGAGEMLEAIALPRLSRSARLGYFKVCRKVGEFASAMTAVLNDPEQKSLRVVIGATKGRPIVLRGEEAIVETEILSVLHRHGITDRFVRRQQVAAVARAYHQTRTS
jgi:carbon-monoxide dehydrogenase medium subunit